MKTRKNVLILTLALFMGIASSQILLAAPPTEGLKLWLKADEGTLKPNPEPNTTDFVPAQVGDAVTKWLDMSGSGHDGTVNWGAPKLISVGSQKAIRFDPSDGDDGYLLANPSGLCFTTLSIYAVVDMDANVQGQIIVSNYKEPISGNALGISDSTRNKVKWFTAQHQTIPYTNNSLEPATLLPSDLNRYTIINATFDPTATGAEKVVYFDGFHVAKGPQNGLGYNPGPIASIGALGDGRQFAKGNFSEILIYDSVNADQYYAVHNYLSQKYGITVVSDYQGSDPTMVYLQYLFLQSSDNQGIPIEGQAWNTTQLYDATYWDLAVLDDTIAHIKSITDPNQLDFHILNNVTNGDIAAELHRGKTYTFAFTGNGTPAGYDLTSDYYSMSFYLDQSDTPGITLFAPKDADGPGNGNPGFDYPAAGPVVWKNSQKGIQVRVTDFVLYPKSAPDDVRLDMQIEPWDPPFIGCQPYDPDGVEDIVGEFTLAVEVGNFTCADSTTFYPMDFNEDCYVDLEDFTAWAGDWLKCNNPADGDCTWPFSTDPNAVMLNNMALRTADESGSAIGGEHWNAIPEDGPWDIALFDTTLVDLATDPNAITDHLVNNPDRSIALELVKGNTYSYAFAFSHSIGSDLGSMVEVDPNSLHSRIDLVFDSAAAGIAGFALNDMTGPSDGHSAIDATADGTLIWKSLSKTAQVRLTDFVIYPKAVAEFSLDIMGTGTSNPTGAFVPDGEEDVVGEFTVVVEDGEFTCTEAGQFYSTDFNEDCYINLEDYALFAQKWLECNDPENENCTWPIE